MARTANLELSSKAALLDSDGKTPLYLQIYAFLKNNIIEGHFASGSLLPSELQLASAFGVSRITAKRALDKIADDKYAIRSRGLGTRVGEALKPAGLVGSLQSLVDYRLAHSTASLRLASFGAYKIKAEIAAALGVPVGTIAHRTERVRDENGTPYALLTSYIPLRIARIWSAEDVVENTIMRLLLRSHLPIERGEQRYSAVNADARSATLLNVKRGAALLKVALTLYTSNDKPIEYSVGLYAPERYRTELALQGDLM